MRTTGWLNFTTFISDASIGGSAWLTPYGAQYDDGWDPITNVTGNAFVTDMQYLRCTNPVSENIPPDATIYGIAVRFKRAGDEFSHSYDKLVRLYVNGAYSGNNKASVTVWPAPFTSATYAVYGGENDTWGLGRIPASHIGLTNFGVGISAIGPPPYFTHSPYVLHVQTQIYFDYERIYHIFP